MSDSFELGALAAVESIRAAIEQQPAELVTRETVLALLDAYRLKWLHQQHGRR